MKNSRFFPVILLVFILLISIGAALVFGLLIFSRQETSTPPTAEAMHPTESIEILPTSKPTFQPSATPDEFDPTLYWTAMQDPHYAVRFALPCFWQVEFPQEYPQNAGIAYSLRNYPYDYSENFPRGEGIFQSGGIKIDMNFMNVNDWGLAPGISLSEFITGLYGNDSETKLISSEEMRINGQNALFVTTESTFGIGKFYLFRISDDTFLIFAPNPEAIANSTVQGILHSLAITPEVEIAWSYYLPDQPPVGLAAPCMGIADPVPDPDAPLPGCFANHMDSPDGLTQALEDLLLTKNIGGLVYDQMNDPMMIGYWGSEGAWRSPLELGSELANGLLPEDTRGLSFTRDRTLFPNFADVNLEVMFGPDVIVSQIVYSQGWGLDGKGGALLYIAEDACGKYYWHGLVYSPIDFEK